MAEAVFYFFAAVAVVSALLCISHKNPIASALWLINTMLMLSGIYILFDAPFIGVIQVLVYAGAVMVLFLFVIMLLNMGTAQTDVKRWPIRILAAGAAIVLAAQLIPLAGYSSERLALEYTGSSRLADPSVVFNDAQTAAVAAAARGITGGIAQPLFETYLVPFELTSILLLAAIVGAVVLAKRRI